MKEVVIVSGSRTAVGTFGGALKTVPAIDLGSIVMRDVFKRIKVRPVKDAAMAAVEPDHLKDRGPIALEKDACDWDDSDAPLAVDEVIMGNVLQAGQGVGPVHVSHVAQAHHALLQLALTPGHDHAAALGGGLEDQPAVDAGRQPDGGQAPGEVGFGQQVEAQTSGPGAGHGGQGPLFAVHSLQGLLAEQVQADG